MKDVNKLIATMILGLFVVIFSVLSVGCGQLAVKTKDGDEYVLGPAKDQPTETDSDDPEDNTDTSGGKSPKGKEVETVCDSVLPPGSQDIAVQRDGHFYETNAKIIMEARAIISSDDDGGQRMMYGDNSRMWVRVPQVIRPVEGRGSDQASICLTVGNVNCSYIWGAKIYVLDQCDFGVQPDDILGAKFFALEVHNTDIAPDVVVRAELPAVSIVR